MEWWSAPDYWLSRVLLQRSLAAVYLVAFLVAWNQFRPLLGENGLLPAARFLRRVRFRDAPSVFHLHCSDRLVRAVAATGGLLSAGAVIGLADWLPLWAATLLWLVLWALYLSIVNLGQIFYGFGWESLLLESGFLAAFLGNADTAPPVLVIWMFRWLLFRLEFGAGLIKLRRDRCWRDFTCLYFHHETQPMPNPLSWYFHHLPKRLHRVEVAASHIAQLVTPFFLFTPQPVAGAAGAVIVITQAWLVASGNFSWLNVLTIVVALSAFDNAFLDAVLPVSVPALSDPPAAYAAAVVGVAVLVAVLSYWPVANMASRNQRMNYCFNRYHLVNTYGAFGRITRLRHEIVIEGTDQPRLAPDTTWQEYEFKGKPGDPRRRPRQIAPYHLRLDWLMWFAAMSSTRAHPWFTHLAVKLLENDAATARLLRRNPFASGAPPTFVRARLFRYRFTTWRERRDTGNWWVRTLVGDYLPPVRLKVPARRDGRDRER